MHMLVKGCAWAWLCSTAPLRHSQSKRRKFTCLWVPWPSSKPLLRCLMSPSVSLCTKAAPSGMTLTRDLLSLNPHNWRIGRTSSAIGARPLSERRSCFAAASAVPRWPCRQFFHSLESFDTCSAVGYAQPSIFKSCSRLKAMRTSDTCWVLVSFLNSALLLTWKVNRHQSDCGDVSCCHDLRSASKALSTACLKSSPPSSLLCTSTRSAWKRDHAWSAREMERTSKLLSRKKPMQSCTCMDPRALRYTFGSRGPCSTRATFLHGTPRSTTEGASVGNNTSGSSKNSVTRCLMLSLGHFASSTSRA
mmetsp:Transcript_48497/g.113523  ORF Transcript_48497/g.113523 Transcript_48497/m.113523 type:complete len:305 (+) Transcript_48497:647-1561(+)